MLASGGPGNAGWEQVSANPNDLYATDVLTGVRKQTEWQASPSPDVVDESVDGSAEDEDELPDARCESRLGAAGFAPLRAHHGGYRWFLWNSI